MGKTEILSGVFPESYFCLKYFPAGGLSLQQSFIHEFEELVAIGATNWNFVVLNDYIVAIDFFNVGDVDNV